jgi:dipeptidyl aminopeptidase/acylaminoacyl peptidase
VDGRAIAYLAKDDAAPPTDEGPQVADREADHERVWRVELESKATRRFGMPGYRIDDFQWRDNARLLLAATAQARTQPRADGVYELSVRDGAITKIATPPQPFDSLAVSPDARSFAVRSTASNGPIERDLFTSPLEGGALKPLAVPGGLGVEELRWPEPKAPWIRVADGMRSRLFRLSPAGVPVAIDLPLSVGSFDVSSRGDLAYVGEDFNHLQEIYLRNRDGHVRTLTHLQSGWDGVRLADAAVLRMNSFDGTPLEAVLMKPAASASSSDKSPLVLLVHGGPASRFTAGYGWDTAWAQLLAAHGYQVLLVNPRGSLGYGEDFVEANRADWGGGDFKDLMTVLDAVIAKGEVDPRRLGIGGGSYGGEMTAWAIGQTQRFRAAVDGAGVFDQQAEFETESNPEEDEWYFGTPWEHPEVFARNSPATFIGNARTPTLILGGRDDESNPVGQSIGLYRALKHLGVETEMVLYPGEGHSPRRGSYNIDMFTRILDWYDRHLKTTGSPQP